MTTFKVRAPLRGFTMLEMMVVVTISLSLMVLLVPVFQITTRTVQTVERKLAVYEAARNILDILESELFLTTFNERGEHLSIKNYTYTDTDSFTDSTNTAPVTARFGRSSRREADSIHYVKLQAGGFRFAKNLLFNGSMAFPLAYPEGNYTTPEAWNCTLHSTLIYPELDRGDGANSSLCPDRPTQLANVNQVAVAMVSTSLTGEHYGGSYGPTFTIAPTWMPPNAGGGSCADHADAVYNALAPGNEVRRAPGWTAEDVAQETLGMTGFDMQWSRLRTFGGVRLMDLEIAYWDADARQFVGSEPDGAGAVPFPDKKAVYFSPPPRALKITITVCDPLKRTSITLSRVVQIPAGMGRCGVGQIDLGANSNIRLDGDPTPYNKTIDIGPGKLNDPNL